MQEGPWKENPGRCFLFSSVGFQLLGVRFSLEEHGLLALWFSARHLENCAMTMALFPT